MAVRSLEELKQLLNTQGRKRECLLGIDHGTQNIGLAVSDHRFVIASPLETIRHTKFTKDIIHLKKVIDDYNIGGIILGLPMNMDGSEGPRCQSVRHYAKNIIEQGEFFGRELEVAFWDERLSSFAVERMLIDDVDMSRARRAEVIDKLAAAHILQGALDHMKDI